MKSLFIKFMSVLLISLTVSFASGAVEISKFQNIKLLNNTDGKIVYMKKLDINSKFKNVECYRIKYLSDNLKVVGFILKQKNIDKNPVMIYNRGGNREYGKIDEKTLKYLSFLASKGYVVLASQYRGNDGGQGFEKFGGKDVNDVLNLIPMAKSLPFADENNIVMLGFSRGGMMTYLALKNQVDIKAAVVVGGTTDLQLSANRDEKNRKKIIELVGHNRNEWKKRSAIYWADKINKPLLILQGSKDWRVVPTHAKKLAKELKKYNKEFKFKIIDGGNHGLTNRKKLRNKFMFEWFDKYLE